jgi:hypothetical protein
LEIGRFACGATTQTSIRLDVLANTGRLLPDFFWEEGAF